ncbi:MAG: RNA polymerase subunit sigma [Symploca sp. SIO2E6]|nr:RNA polymerase subunit sigma [Symploca sp. SIO2E6]
MKFKGADSPKAIAISAALVFSGISFLIWWALQVAYNVG